MDCHFLSRDMSEEYSKKKEKTVVGDHQYLRDTPKVEPYAVLPVKVTSFIVYVYS